MEYQKIIEEKILSGPNFVHRLNLWRFFNKKIVFTNGCFDILHRGHIDYLCKARDFGDILVVGVNSDASVKRLKKSPERPINTEQSRAFLLASLHMIDAVAIFDE